MRALTWGAIAYLAGSSILLLPGVEPGGPAGPFLVARVFQGIGIAATLPAALSLVPRLVPPGRRGFGLAFVGSAHNLTLVVIPPVSLVILATTSLHGVALTVMAIVLAGWPSCTLPPCRSFRSPPRTLGRADRQALPADASGSPSVAPGRRSSRSTCCTSHTGA